MGPDPTCLDCGGTLAWFEVVNAYRHTSVPTGTTPHPARLFPTREESTEQGRLMREALGVIEPLPDRELVAADDVEVVVEPHPAPLVPARLATDDELPASARSVRDLMVEHGWTVSALYSLGAKLTDRNTLIANVVLSATRERNRERIAAWWAGGKFDSAYRFTPGANPAKLKSAEIRTAVKAVVMTCVVCDEPPHTHPLEAPCCPT